jgi:two-component system, chemotaxis family, CheB/CheR fusion protein
MKVLIIEPDADHAGSLASIIRVLGHEPVVCSDPWAAIKSADRCRPVMILLGLSIRGVDVYEYARLLRRQDDLAHVKFVAVSGEVDDPSRAREAGIDTQLLQSHARGLVPVLRETLLAEGQHA